MRSILLLLSGALFCGLALRAQEPPQSSRPAVQADTSEIPEGYEVGEKTVSPDGRFALLYPVRQEDSGQSSELSNVLVRLRPYKVLAEIDANAWQGRRGAPEARWGDKSVVAIWLAQKWGSTDLAIYEVENDGVKRVQKIWPEVEKYFDRDLKERFLKKYPKESDSYTFVSEDADEIEFKGRKLLLNIFADNKPNLAGGPHWTARLRGVWDIDQAKFEKVDFQPGKISVRKDQD